MISPHTGKVIHHNDCTYCVMRHQKNVGTKSRKKERESCLFTSQVVPPPNTDKPRLCERYTQTNCDCKVCQDNYKRFDVETLLDKKDKLW